MGEEHVTFPSGSLTLKGIFETPEGKNVSPAVVLCHPHPLYGGSMDDNVIFAVASALLEKGIATLRFNFRGVGGSEGNYGRGHGEQVDAITAIDFVSKRPDVNPEKTGIAGYSFGGGVAFNVALKDSRVKALALISPVISESGWERLGTYSQPKLYILGDSDQYYPLSEYRAKIEGSLKPEEYRIFVGTDHFWTGSEEAMAKRLADFFGQSLI